MGLQENADALLTAGKKTKEQRCGLASQDTLQVQNKYARKCGGSYTDRHKQAKEQTPGLVSQDNLQVELISSSSRFRR